MGFYDEYKEIGGNWINSDEKNVMIEEGIPFEITAIQHDEANKYGPRFVATVVVPNPETGDEETRSLGFPKGTVESRDRMIVAMEEYLGSDKPEPLIVKLDRVGNSILIREGS
jgi:hypothetical protein